MMKRETISRNAYEMGNAALSEAGGDLQDAFWIACEEWARCWQLKGSGIDREGGPQHDWSPKRPPEPVLIPGEA
jgi:hypothetical protein